MARPVVPRTTNKNPRERRKDASLAAVMNSLVRDGSVVRKGGTKGRDTWKLQLSDAQIPASIARDSEVSAAIAALSTVYQPLDSDLTAIAALSTTSFGRSLLTLADLAAAQALLKSPIPLFDHFADSGNSTTTETDLFSDTLAAGRFGANGDKVSAEYAGTFVSSGTATRQIRIYFGGTQIFDTGALTLSLSSAWDVYVEVIRDSSSSVRTSTVLTTQGAALAAYTGCTPVTGLTLSNTQVLKITGQAAGVGAASNDIVAKLGHVLFIPAA